ncbi:MAG: L,D-transpeptidase [Gemmobacter sp.]|nr:L,D-transpeptidase [Gemmobacter sp.]
MHLRNALTLVAALTLLTACLEQPVEDQPFPVSYSMMNDANYRLPAVPADKINPAYQRTLVANPAPDEAPGTVIIDTATRHLFWIQDKKTALRYGISVGREGFAWSGTAVVDRKQQWPTWTPPPEMIKRQPELAKWADGQPPGPKNPLGARAIYLAQNGHDTGYRIHGTPEWSSIGRAASSGCIRMVNQDVIDLYARVSAGAKVIVR